MFHAWLIMRICMGMDVQGTLTQFGCECNPANGDKHSYTFTFLVFHGPFCVLFASVVGLLWLLNFPPRLGEL